MPRSSGGQKTVWEDRPLTTWQGARLLVLLFCFWKVILFGIIALAPGPGYDTSTTLLVDAGPRDTSTGDLDEVSTKLPGIVKFARWDAIYFAEIIRRGYVFEQEYAFASGYPSIVGFIQSGVSDLL
jgi:GPI mannosyltransferase 2